MDPKAAANPYLFPSEETLANVHQYDSAALNNDDFITAWQGVRDSRRSTGTHGRLPPPAQGGHPVPPARAGGAVARDLLPVPLGFLGYQSLQSGVFPDFEFTWEFSNFSDAISRYHEQLIRSFVYAGLATVVCLAAGLSARLLDRVQGGPVAEPLPALHRRAVLRHVPGADARLAEHPRRPGAGRRVPPRRAHPRRGRPAAGDNVRRGVGHRLQLLPVHGAPDLRLARADRPAVDRGGAGPLRVVVAGVPPGDAAAVGARDRRRHAADLHPGGG